MAQSVIGIVLNEDRTKVLLLKRRDVPVWVLPGGGVDRGETSEEAIIREIYEETGLQTAVVRKASQYSPINSLAKFTDVFECKKVSGSIQDSDESLEVGFYDIKHLPDMFFYIHQGWLNEALNNPEMLIKRPLTEVTYGKLLLYFLRRPLQVIRFLFTRFFSS